MPNAKHKEKVKETSDVLKDCREVLYDGSNEIVAQMLAFMNRVDGRLKQIETQDGSLVGLGMGGEFEFRFNTQIFVKLLLTKIVIQHFQEPEGQQGPDCSQTLSILSFQILSN
jgi:hypothetical protein